jgi:tellurite resistance protein TerA
MPRDTISTDSMSEASRNRADYSGHGSAKGAAGYRRTTKSMSKIF